MKWRAQIRIDKVTKQVVCDFNFPDGVCMRDHHTANDVFWNDIAEFLDAHIEGAIWVKVEYDDGEES